jgi:predicted CopG family antitoxin
MTSKSIPITKEAHDALRREKKESESFTETILRLTRRTGKLSDCFGTWKMTDKEEVRMNRELSKGWKRSSTSQGIPDR